MPDRLSTLHNNRRIDQVLILIWFILGVVLSILMESWLGFILALAIPILVWIDRGFRQPLI